MKDPREFFPGDPPLGEWLIGLFALLSLVSLISCVVALLSSNRTAALNRSVMALLFAVPVAWFLVVRHSGPWKALQSRLKAFEAEARDVLQHCDHNHDCAVYELDRRYGTTTFQITPEYRPVRLYLRRSEDQLVGVDFGSGANVVFDSTWMITKHSD